MKDSYIFATGKKGAARLDLQNNLAMELSIKHLKKAGLSKGMTVLDLGCGVGSMTAYLAKMVGPTGKVYAFDISKEQLLIAQKHIEAENIENAIFIQGDINSSNVLPKNMIDLIYMRYFLIHLRNPQEILTKVKDLLSPEGVILSQESIMGTFSLLNNFANSYIALGRHKGLDYTIGEHIQDIYRNAGYSKVETEHNRFNVSAKDMRKAVLLSLDEWKDKAIEAKIITEEQIILWEEDLSKLSDNLDYFSAKQAYSLAWR